MTQINNTIIYNTFKYRSSQMTDCFISTFGYQRVQTKPELALQDKAISLIKQLHRFIQLKILKQFTIAQAKVILQYVFIEVLNKEASRNGKPPKKQLAKKMQQQFGNVYALITQKIKQKQPAKYQKIVQKMNQLMSGNQLSFANFCQQQQEIGNKVYQQLKETQIQQAFDNALAKIQEQKQQYMKEKQEIRQKQININDIMNLQQKQGQLNKRFSIDPNPRRNFQVVNGVKIYDQSQVTIEVEQSCDVIDGIKYYRQSSIFEFDTQNTDLEQEDQEMKEQLKLFQNQYNPMKKNIVKIQQKLDKDTIQGINDEINYNFKPRKSSYSPEKIKNKFVITDSTKLKELKNEITIVIVTYNSVQTEKLKVFYGESKKEVQINIKKFQMFDIMDSRQYWAILFELKAVPYKFNPKQISVQVHYFYRKFLLFRNQYFNQKYDCKQLFIQTMLAEPKKTLIVVNDIEKDIDLNSTELGRIMRGNAAIIAFYHYLNYLMKQELGNKYSLDLFAWLEVFFEVLSKQQVQDKHFLWLERFIHYPKFINPILTRYLIYLLESLYPNQKEYPYVHTIKSSQFYKQFIIKEKMDRNYDFLNQHHQYLERKYVQWMYFILIEKCMAPSKKDKYKHLLLDYLQANMELQTGFTLASILKQTIKTKNQRLITKDLSCINKVEQQIANTQTISAKDYFNIMTYIMFYTKNHQENRFLAIMRMLKIVLLKLEEAEKRRLKLFTDISFSEKGLQEMFEDDSVECVKRGYLFDNTQKFMSFMKILKKIARKDATIRDNIYKCADRQIVNAFNFPYEPQYLLSILEHPTHEKQMKYIEKMLQKYSLKQHSVQKLLQILQVVYLNKRQYEIDTIQFNNHFSKYWKANQNNDVHLLLANANKIFIYFEVNESRCWQKQLLQGLIIRAIRYKRVLFQYAWWCQHADRLLHLRQDQLKHFGEYVRNNNNVDLRGDAISIQLLLLDQYHSKDIRIVTLEAYKDQALQDNSAVLKRQFSELWAIMTNYYLDLGKTKLKQLETLKKNASSSNRETGAGRHFKDTDIYVMPIKSLEVQLQICQIRFKNKNLPEILEIARSEVLLENVRYDQIQNLFNNLPTIAQKLNIQKSHNFITSIQKVHSGIRKKIDFFKDLSLWQFGKTFTQQNLQQACFIIKSDSDRNQLKQYFEFYQDLETERKIIEICAQLIKPFHDKNAVEIGREVQQFIQCSNPDQITNKKIQEVFQKFKKIQLLWIEDRQSKVSKQILLSELSKLQRFLQLEQFLIQLSVSQVKPQSITNRDINKYIQSFSNQNQYYYFKQIVIKLMESLKEVINIVDKFNRLQQLNSDQGNSNQQVKIDAKTFLKIKLLPIFKSANQNQFITYALSNQYQNSYVWQVLDDLFIFQIDYRAKIEQEKIKQRFQTFKSAIRSSKIKMSQTVLNQTQQKQMKIKKFSSGIIDVKSEFFDLNPRSTKEFVNITPGHGRNKAMKKKQIMTQLQRIQEVSEDSFNKIMKTISELI